jgi:ABC-2 type transport system permease protein
VTTTGAAVRAFVLRDLRVALSLRTIFVAEVLAVLFSVATTLFVAKLVDPSQVPGGYFVFVIAGLMVTTFLSAGFMTVSRNLRAEQAQGTLEAFLGIGVPPRSLAIGMTVYPVMYAVPVAAVVLLIAALFGARFPQANWPVALLALALGAVSFAGIGIVGAAAVVVFRRGEVILGWLLVCLTFAAGDYFPRDLLPGWIRATGELSPFTQCLELVRGALLRGEAGSWWRWTSLALFAVAGWAVGIWALASALRWARRRGTIAQY